MGGDGDGKVIGGTRKKSGPPPLRPSMRCMQAFAPACRSPNGALQLRLFAQVSSPKKA